ncbi:MAG: hypothetical protein WCC54_20060, partial [Pseudolabrys sp.]
AEGASMTRFRRERREGGLSVSDASVRFWHLADIFLTEHLNVRFWGQSGHTIPTMFRRDQHCLLVRGAVRQLS